jgi:hypothetical protein
MGSSGGGGGGNPAHLMMGGTPMAGLPIAGANGAVADPQNYGKYQSFLPDIKAEGPNEMATGLRPDMFNYRSPRDILAGNDGGTTLGGDTGSQIQSLRDELARLAAQQQQGAIGGRLNQDARWDVVDMFNSQPATDRGGGG